MHHMAHRMVHCMAPSCCMVHRMVYGAVHRMVHCVVQCTKYFHDAVQGEPGEVQTLRTQLAALEAMGGADSSLPDLSEHKRHIEQRIGALLQQTPTLTPTLTLTLTPTRCVGCHPPPSGMRSGA